MNKKVNDLRLAYSAPRQKALERVIHGFAIGSLCIGTTLALPAVAQTTQTEKAETAHKAATKIKYYQIPAGALPKVLTQFSANTGVFLVGASKLAKGKNSPGLTGQYSVEQGFAALLAGTDLQAVQQADGSYTLRGIKDEVLMLEPVTVEGAAASSRVTENTGFYLKGPISSATGLNLSIQETPQSVSVMTTDRILDQNLHSLTDIVHNAPGISSKASDSSRHRFSSRGFSIDNYQIDGIPMTWSSGGDAGETQTSTALYERIEIVRGATGLLTGAGNPSASINLVRKHADSSELTGSVNMSAGSWNTHRVLADVANGLNDSGSIRGRAVVSYEDGDSFRDLAGDETSVFYGVLEADVTDDLLVRVGASYQENRPTASTWGGLPSWHSDGSRTDWDRSKTIGADWTAWASTVQNQFADVIYSFDNDWQLKLNVNRNVNEADLKLLYMSGTVDSSTGLGLNPSPYNANTERDQISYSAQLTGDYSLFDRSHDLILGAISSEQDFVSLTRARSNVAPIGDFFEWDGSYPEPTWGAQSIAADEKTKQEGVYAATSLNVTDALTVIVGGRISSWEKTGTSYGSPVDYGHDDIFTPYAGLVYELNNQHSVYASYTDIFSPQNNLDKNGELLDPVTGTNYEIGLKSRFLDDSLFTTVSIFNVVQDNLAQPDGAATVPGTVPPAQAYRAAEGAESTGVELEVVGKITDGWDISFSYIKFNAEDADGVAVNTNQPDELLKVYTTYRFSGELDKLTIAGGLNWQGSNYTSTTNPVTGLPERLEQEAYSLLSFMARYDISPQVSAQLNVGNVLDETYYSQIGFYNQLEYGEPRNIVASINYQF